MVDEYVAWYDRHFDPAWQDVVLLKDGLPWGYVLPKCADDLIGMGRCFAATTFLSAGNITHTPAYGHLIALGVLGEVQQRNVSQQQIDNAEAYRQHIARTGRFLTFSSGAATIGYRMRPDPAERAALRIVRETDSGVVIRGKIGMHTSPAYAEDIYVGALCGADYQGHRATFIVPVNAPGVTHHLPPDLHARRQPVRLAAVSSRYDELDGQMWLDDVHVPWERMFLVDPSPEPIARWLFWHQLYCWLSKAEVTLGLALACTHAMGLIADAGTNRLSARSDHRRADGAELPGRRRTRSAVHRGGLLLSQRLPPRRRQHRHAEGASAHERNAAHRARLLARRRTDGS